MAEPNNDSGTAQGLRPTPALPRKLVDLWPIVVAGTAAWLIAFVLLVVARFAFDAQPGVWLWATLAGFVLGLIGLAITTWQRAASRRGSRGAQRDL